MNSIKTSPMSINSLHFSNIYRVKPIKGSLAPKFMMARIPKTSYKIQRICYNELLETNDFTILFHSLRRLVFLLSIWFSFDSQQFHIFIKFGSIGWLEHYPFSVAISCCFVILSANGAGKHTSYIFKF